MPDQYLTSTDDFEAVLAEAPTVLAVTDEELTIRFVSPAIERVLGYDMESLVGTNWLDLVHPADTDRVLATLTGEREDDGTEYRFRNADGDWVWLETIVSSDTETDRDCLVFTSRDVSDRPRFEARFHQFVTHTSDVLTVFDEQGNVEYISPSVERVLGYEQDEMQDSDLFEYVHPDDLSNALTEFGRMIDEPGYVAVIEHRYRHADGDWIWAESRGQQVANGPLEDHVVVTTRDISARKQREQELERQNQRLERFSDAISHDLRNPLDVLDGSLELARETGEEAHFERAERSIDRMYTLIDDLLVLAKQGVNPAEIETIDLNALSQRAWSMVDTQDATLETEADDSIKADEGAMLELLENLFRNAVEHGGDDVTVTVGTESWGFYVTDDGAGFPDGTADLFKPGYSTADDGTGFGLCIVEQIVDAHNWEVIATDSESGGARFEFICCGS
ncbi:signal-transducing histidine kinase-like [Haloarcula marismortui ATCC 43049]|uniref:histidine kinase n=1 Tax=Haloarcula marismortui (strain ATCC 43049 / DSM 3752 / JCM 8966 / VKM B-1809) TaxID=272569 RepID=Q5V346_HALMA|nr:PAS domain-containing sensor histidine kinase [Haloarcula marismortui]AAV46056.1 signal-transducing histidine kinase-like [Haloarcula marismortui ATCC 43049]QCP90820.1 PAS domain-containing sensor histidine kinase [Haloarcula marismortui ATCC 43049]